MRIVLPARSLVVLVGASGSGKSTFARTHFRATEVLSSDVFRGLVSDDESSTAATSDAFEALHHVAALRLRAGRLAVIDATSVWRSARRPLLDLARRHGAAAVAIVLDLPEATCQARNLARPERHVPPNVVRRQLAQLRSNLPGLTREGFDAVYVLRGEVEIDDVEIVRSAGQAAPTSSEITLADSTA